MKAQVLYGIDDLRLEEVEIPQPGVGEALVEVKAAGICGSDVPRICYTGAHRHPLIPGHEFSGVVRQVGEGTDGDLQGKRVGVFPLIPCRRCVPCRKKQYEMCRSYNYLGSRCDGGFAEYVVVPADNLIPLPDQVTFEEAAMLEPMAVAVHAMRRAGIGVCIEGVQCDGLRENDKDAHQACITVIGLGTIGLLLTMFLKDAGVDRILAVGNKEEQRRKAKALGVEEQDYCDIRTQNAVDFLKEHTGGEGADVVFECVGKEESVTWAIEAAASAGRVVLVGNPASDMKLGRDTYWRILRNQLEVCGTWNSSFTGENMDDWHYVLERLEEGAVHPAELISHRFSLDRLSEGLEIMCKKTEDYTKIMVIPG